MIFSSEKQAWKRIKKTMTAIQNVKKSKRYSEMARKLILEVGSSYHLEKNEASLLKMEERLEALEK